MPHTADKSENEEEFHSSLRIYLNAVEMLAGSPEEACRLMGDYNVAWELKQDVQNGVHLLGRGYLDEAEESWVGALCAVLEQVNARVLPAGAGRELNLLAMSNPVWLPARHLAAEVRRRLDRATSINASFHGSGDSAA